MLAVKSYPPEAFAAARQRMAALLDGLEASSGWPATGHAAALEAWVLALEAHFIHRMRGQEGKVAGPLHELRWLAEAIVGDGLFPTPAAALKYRPEASCCGLAPGAPLVLEAARLRRLLDGVLAELEARFGA